MTLSNPSPPHYPCTYIQYIVIFLSVFRSRNDLFSALLYYIIVLSAYIPIYPVPCTYKYIRVGHYLQLAGEGGGVWEGGHQDLQPPRGLQPLHQLGLVQGTPVLSPTGQHRHPAINKCFGSGFGWIRVFSPIRTLKTRFRIRSFFALLKKY